MLITYQEFYEVLITSTFQYTYAVWQKRKQRKLQDKKNVRFVTPGKNFRASLYRVAQNERRGLNCL